VEREAADRVNSDADKATAPSGMRMTCVAISSASCSWRSPGWLMASGDEDEVD
jgi:hypothetical protein